jgi:predicted Zn-dependent protease with MMP-like domain
VQAGFPQAKVLFMDPSLQEMEALAQVALKRLPQELLVHVDGVVIQVEEFPDRQTVRELNLQSRYDLLGLYRGVPIDQKSVTATPDDIDMIFMYRGPILDFWNETGEDLSHLVRHVLIHEIGHHFGLSDADMERIES